MRYRLFSLCLLLLVAVNAQAHGSETGDTSNQVSFTLPQIFALTLVLAVILLFVLYGLGITDRQFLVKTLLIASFLLTIDYVLASEFL